MFCIGCDYPLAGLSSRCPECGRPFDPSDPSTFATQSRKTRRSQTLSFVLSVISAVFGTVSLALGLGASGRHLHFGPDYIIPAPFDPRLIVAVPLAVAKAAMASGVAQHPR